MWYAAELEPLLAVAALLIDESGTLIGANAGFLRLIGADGLQPIGAPAAHFFIQPDFPTLLRLPTGPGREIYSGLLTIGHYLGRTRSLRGRVWRVDEGLRFLAEYDVGELERLYDAMIDLNQVHAVAQLELAQVNLKLQERETQIIAASLTDPLTGVGNRRLLEQALRLEISRASRTGEAFSALMADLDHFKHINDTSGHEAGDEVLASFGALLRRETRLIDTVARFGGEEFVVLLPHTDLDQALALAERIRVGLAAHPVEPRGIAVTASFGVASLAADEEGDALLRRIDGALYKAKASGRNRVVAG